MYVIQANGLLDRLNDLEALFHMETSNFGIVTCHETFSTPEDFILKNQKKCQIDYMTFRHCFIGKRAILMLTHVTNRFFFRTEKFILKNQTHYQID